MSNTNNTMPTQTSSVLHNDTVSSCSTSKVQEKTQLLRSRCMNSLREIKSQFKFLTETLQDFGTMPIFKRTFSQDLDLLEQHLTKDILSQTDCNTTLTKLRTTFENAFNSEFKERMQKYTRFDAQSFKDAMICNMDSIGKYMLEIIIHQQRTPQLKEISKSETALNKSEIDCNLDSEIKDVHAIKDKMSKSKERCMTYFRSLHSHLQVLSKENLKGTRIEHGFKRALMHSLVKMMILSQFRDTLLQHMGNVKNSVAERTCHQRQYDKRVNKRQMQTQESKTDTGKALDVELVVTESSGTESEVQDDSSRPGNDTDIRPVYDEEPMAEVQLIAERNIFATGQQHTKQLEIINEGRVDQYTEQCQVKSPMLDSSLDNKTTEFSSQSLESENSFLKKTVAQFQKDFSRMEAHCIALELKYQNQALKSGQHGQILNETSNKAKNKKEIDAYETIHIELEHSVAKLLTEYEHLNKENETIKKHYKDLYDSIKITRSKTIEQTISLLANNVDLKA
ncbi:hypothetical protein Tco_0211039 [Tanacetum coccineum]